MRRDEHETITIRDVRCACAVCGAHLVAWQGHELSGWCENCGSYEVRALAAAPVAGAAGAAGYFIRGSR
jgi:hypothetical protein